MIADILLICGATGAAIYCLVLSRRLRRFADLETGVGGAIAVLSAQVDDMTRSLERAQLVAQTSAAKLEEVTGRAEIATRRLELLMASLHDLPDAPDIAGAATPARSAAEQRGDGGIFAKRAATFASSRRSQREEAR